MSATIRDVAKLAGVSASTVSRVINKSAPISGETTERIYRAMEELKYVLCQPLFQQHRFRH